MSKTRFDFEQEILNCWNVTDDLKMLMERHLDGPRPLTEDELSNALLGLITLYNMKFERMWETFEYLIKAKQL